MDRPLVPLVIALFLVPALSCTTQVGLAAAELPVTAVTVLPDGLLIECRGTLPPGDRLISGLPVGLTAGRVLVSGADDREPAWRLVPAPVIAPIIPLNAAAQAALAVAERSGQMADKRSELAALLTAPIANSPIEAGGQQKLIGLSALFGPKELGAQLAFAASNAQQAAVAAQKAADDAASARALLGQGIVPAIVSGPQLELTDASAGPLLVRYRIGGATWRSTWRIELDAQGAQLVHLAEIDLAQTPTSDPVALTVSSFGTPPPVLLPEPRIPLYGLGESMAIERPADPLAAGGKHGGVGSEGSETAIEGDLATLSRIQGADGSWENGTHTQATTAMAVLVYLGKGYDHRTPNKYRMRVKKTLDWLSRQNPQALELPALGLVTCALAEAYSMTADTELKAPVERNLALLRTRTPVELADWCARDGALAGPEVGAIVASAFKSAQAASMDIGDSLTLVRVNGPDAEEERLAQLMLETFAGPLPHISVQEARQWADAAPQWLSSGRCELLNLAILVAFQSGGDVWKIVNGAIRPLLFATQSPDRLWDTPYPLGRLSGSLLCMSSMNTYYRYAQIAYRSPIPTQPAEIPWPIRITAAAAVHLNTGRQTIELRRTRLNNAVHLEAVPALDPTVWRVLDTPNPWPGVLPSGPLVVVADGRTIGSSTLPLIAPGDPLHLGLGADERYRIRRETVTTTEDNLLSRTLTVSTTCTLEAAASAHDPVTIRESLPAPGNDGVRVALTAPASLQGAEYRERVQREPLTTLVLTPGGQLSGVIWSATFTYSRALRPRLETR